MSKKFTIRLLVVVFVVLLGFGAWAGSRYSGGSFFSCAPGTDLNGDGVPDCSYVAQFLWQGGPTGPASAAAADLVVREATLVCDNRGTPLKVTFGKGTRLAVEPSAGSIGQVAGNGNFTTFSSFPNTVEDFNNNPALFNNFWFNGENKCRNKTQTPVAIFLTVVEVRGTFCNDVNDPTTCVQSPVLTCTTNNTFGEPPVIYNCTEGA
jgi:hypothetical protein